MSGKKKIFYYCVFEDPPLEVVELAPVWGTRGATITGLKKWETYGDKVKIGSTIVSIDGCRVTKNVFANIQKRLDAECPVNVRFETTPEGLEEHEQYLNRQRASQSAIPSTSPIPGTGEDSSGGGTTAATTTTTTTVTGMDVGEEGPSRSVSGSITGTGGDAGSEGTGNELESDWPSIDHQSSTEGGVGGGGDTTPLSAARIPRHALDDESEDELGSSASSAERVRAAEEEAARLRQQLRLSYRPPPVSRRGKRSKHTASGMVAAKAEAAPPQHKCHICRKVSSKSHFCKRCGKPICSLHGQTRRREIGYDRSKSVRVCQRCVDIYEYEVHLTHRPYGFQSTPSEDEAYAIISHVKPDSVAMDAGLETDSVIIEINGKNIEKKDYQTVVNRIHAISSSGGALRMRLKRLNEFTANPKERIAREEAEALAAVAAAAEAKKSKKKKRPSEIHSGFGSLSASSTRRTSLRSYRASMGRQSIDQPRPLMSDRPSGGGHRRSYSRQSSRSSIGTMTPPGSNYDSDDSRDAGMGGGDESEADEPDFVGVAREAGNAEIDGDWSTAMKLYQRAIKMVSAVIDNELTGSTEHKRLRADYEEKMKVYRTKVLRLSKRIPIGSRAKKDDYTRGAGRDHSSAAKAKLEHDEGKQQGSSGGGSGTGDGDAEDGGGGGKKKKDRDDEFRERLMQDIVDDAPDVSFADVMGLADVKLALYETVILPSLKPELFTGLRKPGMGILLFGPPGNGKTMIAKCIATEIECTFFSISASSITSKFVGDAERIMRTLFTLAREKAPSIIFIDEIDSLLTARGGKSEAESSRRIKTEFLIQFDGVQSAKEADKKLLLIGATNLPDQLDDAVLRRMSKRIMVPLPDEDGRYGLLRIKMNKQKHCLTEEDFQTVVEWTAGYSGSDMANLCTDAAMGPIRELGAGIIGVSTLEEIEPIGLRHFKQSVKNVRPSVPAESLRMYSEWDSKYGSKLSFEMSALPPSMHAKSLPDILQV